MPESRPTCFIAMPVTTHEHEVERYDADDSHWLHVMETIFVPAIEDAGFEAIRPVASGTHLIHSLIVKHLSKADMVLCDLSGHNPNVFFELGVRTSLNLPIALVRDEHTAIPFDTSGLNTHQYVSTLQAWNTRSQVEALRHHLDASVESCHGSNPMWHHYGLSISAQQPSTGGASSSDAKLELIFDGMNRLQRDFYDFREQQAVPELVQPSAGLLSTVNSLAKELSVLLDADVRPVRRTGPSRFALTLNKREESKSPRFERQAYEVLVRHVKRWGFDVIKFDESLTKFNVVIDLTDSTD